MLTIYAFYAMPNHDGTYDYRYEVNVSGLRVAGGTIHGKAHNLTWQEMVLEIAKAVEQKTPPA